MLFIDFKLGTQTEQLKTFRNANKNFLNIVLQFYRSHYISAFSPGNVALLNFVKLQTLVLFFLLLFGFFLRVSMFFLLEHFCLNTNYENILLHSSLEEVKTHEIKKKFYPTPTNLQYKIIHSYNYA